MARADLLALSADDLTALANRGLVNRARRDVEEQSPAGAVHEADDGTVTATWSDGSECQLPGGQSLRQARCSCGALGVCRHLLRTVLAYQQQAARASVDQPPAALESWDPGQISDDELARHYRPAAFRKIRETFEQGVLVELVRSGKPSARFHLQTCVVRFLVPGDVRYTHCDCAEPAPCRHVALAVWSFRLLEPDRQSGVLAAGQKAPPAPPAVLDDVELALGELCEHGVSGAAAGWLHRLARLEDACRAGGLIWPAEIVAEMLQQQERYAAHDARFGPDDVAALAGELLLRADAIRSDTAALPQLLIRGTQADRPTVLDAARFIGLGCGIRMGRRSVELSAFLQDSNTGSVVAVSKDFAEADREPDRPPRSFGELGHASAVKETSFAILGAGQLLIRGGKRLASGRLLVGRADASVSPQAFAWEKLHAPALVEDFSELDARLAALPPSSLRPRRVGEDFHVCPVAAVEAAHFDSATQSVRAVLRDPQGKAALLVHPYTSRGRAGAELLLEALTARAGGLRFVSATVRRRGAELLLEPVCLVFKVEGKRTALQPWIEQRSVEADEARPPTALPWTDPLNEYLLELQAALGELFVVGLQRCDEGTARRWRQLQRHSEALGFGRLAAQVGALAEALGRKQHELRWQWQTAVQHLLRLAVLARMAQDVVSWLCKETP